VFQVLEWFLFGMFVWGCCIVMSALSRKFAPEMDITPELTKGLGLTDREGSHSSHRHKDAEIASLKQRIETLEAIVTDPKYRWDQEMNQHRSQTS